MSFHGFPDEALAFYEGLEADNSKAYWTDNRDSYERHVKAPMEALLTELEPEFGAGKLFRPYRDVRFSKDKTPYKEHGGAVVGYGEAPLYVEVSAAGLLVAGGCYSTQSDQVERYRRAVADDVQGVALQGVVDRLRSQDFQVVGNQLRTYPRGYDRDHPRIDLLRHRTIYARRAFPPEPWLHTAECASEVRDAWRAMAPLIDWLGKNVGATAMPRRGRD